MAEKKIQENPLPEVVEPPISEPADKFPDMPTKQAGAKPIPPTTLPSPRITMPSFTKMEPNDLYRRLLPAVLFVLTFVTVMTMLLIYMDTVALGAQQFRLNMSRDVELARIPAAAPALVAYVRQLQLAPRQPRGPTLAPAATPAVDVLDRCLGEIHNGTFVEFLPSGPRSQSTLYLEWARGWAGVVVRAAARDYLALRASARAAHACLSTTPHPREVSMWEAGAPAVFRSRVLCLPLLTLLLAADAAHAHYVMLAAPQALPALQHLPFDKVELQMIEIRATDLAYRRNTTDFLITKNYTVAASFDESIMYVLNQENRT